MNLLQVMVLIILKCILYFVQHLLWRWPLKHLQTKRNRNKYDTAYH